MSNILNNLGDKSDFIFFICIINFLLILYLLYCNFNKKEGFALVDDINTAINTRYGADVEAIRNLSNLATQLTASGLTVPGDLSVTGYLNMNNKPIGNVDNLRLTGENCILMDNGTSNKWLIHAYKDTNNKNLSIRGWKNEAGKDWTEELFSINQNGGVSITGVNGFLNMNNKAIDNIGQLRLTDENCIVMDNGTSNKWLIHAYKPTAANGNNNNLSIRGWNSTTSNWTGELVTITHDGTVNIIGNLNVNGKINNKTF